MAKAQKNIEQKIDSSTLTQAAYKAIYKVYENNAQEALVEFLATQLSEKPSAFFALLVKLVQLGEKTEPMAKLPTIKIEIKGLDKKPKMAKSEP